MDKGQFIFGGEVVNWIAKFIILSLVIFLIVLVIGTGIGKKETHILQHNLISFNILSGCFNYVGGRIHPSTIKLEEFNQANFERCFAIEDNKAVKLQLSYVEKSIELNLNKNFIDRIIDCKKQDLICKKTNHPVIVYSSDGNRILGKLTIESYYYE